MYFAPCLRTQIVLRDTITMLLELTISDFAIIDHLHLSCGTGFTVLTGETGAGKSIIIDALGILRGDKASSTLVRAGCRRAVIEGRFSLRDTPHILPIIQHHGLWDGHSDTCTLKREIDAKRGRSRARLNGHTVTLRVLRDVGGRLVDIHGQHQGVSLFQPRTHLDMLDRYGDLMVLRGQVQEYVAELRRLNEEIASLQQSEEQRQARCTELRQLVEDVQQADLQAGEEQQLLQERQVLQHAARITELVEDSYILLSAGSDTSLEGHSQQPILTAMDRVMEQLAELASVDPSATPLSEQATDLYYQVEDLSTNLRTYRDTLNIDPHRLDTIEERLAAIRAIKRKYAIDDVDALLERAATAETELSHLSRSDERIAELQTRVVAIKETLGKLASDLSRRRRATSDRLSRAIEAAMGELALPHVRFSVSFEHTKDPRGVPYILPSTPDDNPPRSNDRSNDTNDAPNDAPNDPPSPSERSAKAKNTGDIVVSSGESQGESQGASSTEVPSTYHVTPTGIDRVEFLLSPNPGEPLKSLAQIASGGESARLLLALKSILSRVDMVPTLVFDEVDVGVGGRAGQVVGQKLWMMTDTHQVINITHLPQVAAFADEHYAIRKEVGASAEGGDIRTVTRLRRLSQDERVDELAAMLDGTPISEHSRASAREMMDRSQMMKSMHRLHVPFLTDEDSREEASLCNERPN